MSERKRGFTVIELVLVIGIIAVLSFVTFIGLSGRKSKTELDGITKQMASLLREAQSRSVSQSSSTTWGVHFANPTSTTPFYALFAGSAYATSSELGHYALPSDVSFVTSTIAAGSSLDITFSQVGGGASTSTSIAVYITSQPNSTSTISVSTAGAISY